MKFTYAAVVAFCALNGSDAFFSQTFIKGGQTHAITRSSTTPTAVSMADDGFSDDFVKALKAKEADESTNHEDVGSGSSRFKEMLKATQQSATSETQYMPRAIENPFLNPPPPSTPSMPPQPLASSPGDLSVEEQARLFREMMAQQQGAAVPPPPPAALAKADRAGRPVGRNRDADSIANAADVYFAQLKRDSTVRTLARIRGEDEVAEKVFEDEGIVELGELLQKNPYLQGQRDKDKELIDEIPGDILAPYFDSGTLSEEEKTKSGPSYRQKLMERRERQQGTSAATQNDVNSAPAPQPASTESYSTTQQPTLSVSPASVTQQSPSGVSLSSSHEESRQKIRTLMGLLLKHRGGPGFGKGRLKGTEVDRFEALVQEVSVVLREEAKNAQPVASPLTVTPPATSRDILAPSPHVAATQSTTGTSSTTNIDSTLACIDGAITMYKRSPPELKSSVLVTVRAALVSAVDTCNAILASQPPPVIPGNPDGRIDDTIAVIEGAVNMYRCSPPEIQESVLVTLRAALISAVETCSVVAEGSQMASPPNSSQTAAPTIAQIENLRMPESSPAVGADPNSRRLEEIYGNINAAAGDGKLGLRGDLKPEEANELADQLVEMKSLLMAELESGIPDSMPALQTASGGVDSSTASKYQQMLAKARAEKAAG